MHTVANSKAQDSSLELHCNNVQIVQFNNWARGRIGYQEVRREKEKKASGKGWRRGKNKDKEKEEEKEEEEKEEKKEEKEE